MIPSETESGHSSKLLFMLGVVLAAATAGVYLQTHSFDFINYDDPVYVTENPRVLEGLTAANIKWAFTSMHGSNWFPITWLSLMLNRELFGINPGAFHLVNVLLHVLSTILLFAVMVRASKAIWPSFMVAAIFGLHPLHIESVAWITERKDVLSTVFWMLTMLAYVSYTRRRAIIRYLWVAVFLILGLMSKPMLVTLPFVLLLLDYWPLRRVALAPVQNSAEPKLLSPAALFLEKLPLIAISAASCVVTFIAQRSGGTVSNLRIFSLSDRLSNAAVSYLMYVAKMFWPAKLAIFYPHPYGSLPLWKIAAGASFLIFISLIVWFFRTRRYLVVGWLWYLGTLIPVIGLVQVGVQAMADRYTYVTLIGPSIMVGWAAYELLSRLRYRNALLAISALGVCAAMGISTFIQVGYWKDSFTLFRHALDVTTGNDVVHNNLGIALAQKQDYAGAIEQFEATLKINPVDLYARYNLARAFASQGRIKEALENFNKALEIKPDDSDTYLAMAELYERQGRLDKAVDIYRKGIELDPDSGQLHGGLGSALLRMGSAADALRELQTAAALHPGSTIYVNLGLAAAMTGDLDNAIQCYRTAIRFDPKNEKAYYNLANALMTQGKLPEAAEQYRKAIALKEDYTQAYGNLAVAMIRLGRLDDAIESFRRVAELDPNSPQAHFNLAGALMDKRLPAEATEQMRRAVELAPDDVEMGCMLAELLMHQRRLDESIAEFRRILEISPQNPRALAGLQRARAMKQQEQSGR